MQFGKLTRPKICRELWQDGAPRFLPVGAVLIPKPAGSTHVHSGGRKTGSKAAWEEQVLSGGGLPFWRSWTSFNWLDTAHLRQGRPSALLLVASWNSLTQTHTEPCLPKRVCSLHTFPSPALLQSSISVHGIDRCQVCWLALPQLGKAVEPSCLVKC